MKRIQKSLPFLLLAAAVVILAVVVLVGGEKREPAPECPPTVACASVSERVIDLPDDSATWYLSLVYRDRANLSDPASAHLANAMATEPRLVGLVRQLHPHVNVYDPSAPLFAAKGWDKFMAGDYPALVLQAPPATPGGNGRVVYRIQGKAVLIPKEQIADEIATAVASWRPCPKPDPKPVPPDPAVVPPSVPPDIRPVEPDSGSGIPLWVYVVVVIGSALAGAYVAFKRAG